MWQAAGQPCAPCQAVLLCCRRWTVQQWVRQRNLVVRHVVSQLLMHCLGLLPQMDKVTNQLKSNNTRLKGLVTQVGCLEMLHRLLPAVSVLLPVYLVLLASCWLVPHCSRSSRGACAVVCCFHYLAPYWLRGGAPVLMCACRQRAASIKQASVVRVSAPHCMHSLPIITYFRA